MSQYDTSGRLQYRRDYHPSHGNPWTTSDERYLIDYYGYNTPEEIGLALGRTTNSVTVKARRLRAAGRLTVRSGEHVRHKPHNAV